MDLSTLSLPTMLAGAFMAGAAGSFHCLGMCGGIASVLGSHARNWSSQLSYQFGRLLSYSLLGALGAGLLQWITLSSGLRLGSMVLRVVLALILILIGLYLLFGLRAIDFLTQAGAKVWQRLSPLAGRWLPPRHAGHALLLGLIWGWLPCGLVYAMLGAAWATANTAHGALLMLAFGAGTLPMMATAAFSAQWTRRQMSRPLWRRLAGVLLLITGAISLIQMSPMMGHGAHHHNHGAQAGQHNQQEHHE